MTPKRSGPVRNPVVAPRGPAPEVGAAFGTAVDESLRTAERLAEISSTAVRGAVECGVQTAYTVIDEYMRRGREAAGRYAERPNWRGDMNDDRQNYSNLSTAWGPMWPFIAPWMQAMQAWTSAMSTFVPGAVPQDPWNPCGQYATSPKVSVRVSSRYPTEVIPSVAPGAYGMKLSAEPLQIVDGADASGAPALTGVAITCEREHVLVSVTVPNDQPPGRYSGAIRNADGKKVGDLTVQISGPAPRSPGKAA